MSIGYAIAKENIVWLGIDEFLLLINFFVVFFFFTIVIDHGKGNRLPGSSQ